MDGIIVIGILVLGGLAIAHANRHEQFEGAYGMEDTPVSAENIRKGVSRGWYTATLTRVAGQPAIRLRGTSKDGAQIVDTFPISQDDFDALQNEGYLIEA